MALEALKNHHQFGVGLWKLAPHRVEVFGVANARNNVFALGVDEKVTVRLVLARGRVTSEPDACTRVAVAVTEHHCLNVDRSAEIVADLFAHAVSDRACSIPRTEHGLDSAAQLLGWLLGKFSADFGFDNALVCFAKRLQCSGRNIGVIRDARQLLGLLERMLELGAIDAEHNPAVHRDESAVRVVRKSFVACVFG